MDLEMEPQRSQFLKTFVTLCTVKSFVVTVSLQKCNCFQIVVLQKRLQTYLFSVFCQSYLVTESLITVDTRKEVISVMFS